MGNILRDNGMGELATQEYLGGIIGRGKSVLEVGRLISDTFNSIDNAPKALKDTLNKFFPNVDRTALAKALLTGKEGAAELDKKIKGISVLSAAESQGVTIGMDTASDLAARGYDYNQSLTGFGQVKQLERGVDLGRMSGIDLSQQETQSLIFEQNQAVKEKVRKIQEGEEARFRGSSGRLASQNRTAGQY